MGIVFIIKFEKILLDFIEIIEELQITRFFKVFFESIIENLGIKYWMIKLWAAVVSSKKFTYKKPKDSKGTDQTNNNIVQASYELWWA